MTVGHETIDELAEARERREGEHYDAELEWRYCQEQARESEDWSAEDYKQLLDGIRATAAKICPEQIDDSEVIQPELGACLRKARIRAGLSRLEVAKRMDAYYADTVRLEEGREKKPGWDQLQQYAEAINCRLRLTLEPLQ